MPAHKRKHSRSRSRCPRGCPGRRGPTGATGPSGSNGLVGIFSAAGSVQVDGSMHTLQELMLSGFGSNTLPAGSLYLGASFDVEAIIGLQSSGTANFSFALNGGNGSSSAQPVAGLSNVRPTAFPQWILHIRWSFTITSVGTHGNQTFATFAVSDAPGQAATFNRTNLGTNFINTAIANSLTLYVEITGGIGDIATLFLFRINQMF
jgi:hypothetical protein